MQLPFGDDGDAVAQQVGLIHVMSGQDHSAACTRSELLSKSWLVVRSSVIPKLFSAFTADAEFIGFMTKILSFVVATQLNFPLLISSLQNPSASGELYSFKRLSFILQ